MRRANSMAWGRSLFKEMQDAVCEEAMFEIIQVEEECEVALDCLFLTDHKHGSIERRDTRFISPLPGPVEDAIDSELHAVLVLAVAMIPSWRGREIIKLLYGLTDGYSYTHDEVARIFRLSAMRIAQIEAKSLRQLQQPNCCAMLAEFT